MAKFKLYSTNQGETFPENLDECIDQDHLVRLISEIVDQLDLSVITDQYSRRGEEAYHPAMMLKLWFYGYATGIFTCRKIRTAIDESIPFRWLCRGHRPDYRTINDFRKNHLEAFPDLFTQIIEMAIQKGYVTLSHVSIDGSKIKANASKHKAMSRKRMEQEIQRLEKDIQQGLKEAQQADEQDEAITSLQTEIADLQVRLTKIKTSLEKLEQRKPKSESPTPETDQINFTDEESRIMTTKTQGVIQGFNPQIGVDDKQHMIVGFSLSNNSSDQQQFEAVIQSVKDKTEQFPQKVSADAGYCSAENIQIAASHQIDAYISVGKEGKKVKNPYHKTHFHFDAHTDTYACPAGKTMVLKYIENQNNPSKTTKRIYECQSCHTCPFQKDCVKAKSGKRTLTRTENEPLRESMRAKVQSDEGKDIYRLRKAIVEPAWGEMKEIQGFRQFHLRGEKKVTGEFTLLALSYNLRKLHSAKYPKEETLYKRERSAQKRKKAA